MLGFYFIENAKIMYEWGLILWRMVKECTTKVRLGTHISQNAKIRYDRVFLFVGAEIMDCWGFILLKMLNLFRIL